MRRWHAHCSRHRITKTSENAVNTIETVDAAILASITGGATPAGIRFKSPAGTVWDAFKEPAQISYARNHEGTVGLLLDSNHVWNTATKQVESIEVWSD